MGKEKAIQLNTIDLGGGTTKGCDCEAPNLGDYAKKEDVPKKVSELENDSGFVESTSLGTAAYANVEDLQVLSFIEEESFGNWYQYEGKTKTVQVNLSSYSKSLLKIGLSLDTNFVDDERSVHIIDENGNLLGSISGITDTNPDLQQYPYEVFATCEKMAADIYKIEISGLEQHIVTYSDKPIGYVMAGVYSQASTPIIPGRGYGKILIYALKNKL